MGRDSLEDESKRKIRVYFYFERGKVEAIGDQECKSECKKALEKKYKSLKKK